MARLTALTLSLLPFTLHALVAHAPLRQQRRSALFRMIAADGDESTNTVDEAAFLRVMAQRASDEIKDTDALLATFKALDLDGNGVLEVNEIVEALAATREEIGRLEAESVSLAVAAQYGTELGDAMEYARKRAELLHAAQQAGREITPQLTAEIDAQAMAYMKAALAAEENADRLQKLQANAERGADAMSNLFMNILDGSMSAKDAVLQLVAEIARIQTMKLFQNAAATSGGGGLFGFMLALRVFGP